jgi:hypothetical protein
MLIADTGKSLSRPSDHKPDTRRNGCRNHRSGGCCFGACGASVGSPNEAIWVEFQAVRDESVAIFLDPVEIWGDLVSIALGRHLRAALGTPKLSVVMPVLFVCLSIPILIFILLYNHHVNSVAIRSTLSEDVAKTNQASIENAENFINRSRAHYGSSPQQSPLSLLSFEPSKAGTFFSRR